MQRVLVTDADQRSSLAVVRSLGRATYHVEVCATHDAPLAGASRFSRGSHRVTDPTDDASAFTADLTNLVDDRGIDVLLPMTDVTASVALALRHTFPELVIPFPSTEAWQRASDKKHLMDVAGELGVPAPRQRVIEDATVDVSEAIAFAEGLGFPVVLKPHRSAVATPERVLRFGVQIATERGDLVRRLKAFRAEAFPILLQEHIRGPGMGGFFLAEEGRIVQQFAHRRLREKPPTGGVSVLREGVPLRADVRRYSQALLERFGWSGVAMVEFKEDAASGTVYLMEINGRFWGSLQLAIDCGVDFPTALLASFLEPRSKPASTRTFEAGVQSRWLWGDLDHLLWILRSSAAERRDHPDLPGRLRALARFLMPWRPGLRYEVLRLSDPVPFFRESRQWLAHALFRKAPG